MTMRKWVALASGLFLASSVCWAQQWGRMPGQEAQLRGTPDFVWKQSLPIAWGSPQINAIGGTEVRSLVVFDNKLFAAIGYWMDNQRENPALPGAQVLRLDGAGSRWQIDLELTDRAPEGLKLYQAISTLGKVRFTTDSAGRQLAAPVDLLLAAVWKRGTGLDVFSRTIGSAPRPWSKIPIPGQENTPPRTQVRDFASHRDQVTGIDMVFAGATDAIFSGKYDGDRRSIVWNPQLEWEGELPESGRARVASLADCNGKLYATSAGTIYERSDGNSPRWRKVFETTINSGNPRVTGLRGLTCLGGLLLAGVEDNPARIYRIDPRQAGAGGGYSATMEVNVSSLLSAALGTEATYAIVAYNVMTEYPDPARGCSRLLIGLETITPQGAGTFGRQRLDPRGHYLVRDCDGHYAVHEVRDSQITPPPELVSVRTFAVSPFSSDAPGTVYARGFDANSNPVHNTAWLYKGVPTQ